MEQMPIFCHRLPKMFTKSLHWSQGGDASVVQVVHRPIVKETSTLEAPRQTVVKVKYFQLHYEGLKGLHSA
jgi:hypothetical protein